MPAWPRKFLSPKIRDILVEASKEATPWMQEQARDLEAKYFDLIQKKGVKVIDETNGLDVESFREATKTSSLRRSNSITTTRSES
jgi:TRAP-type C4-dicarboxylate transport system substrate-binding protein